MKYFTRIDRYIMKKFLGTYLFSIVLIMTISIVFDFNERIDKFTQSQTPAKKIIVDYYLNFIPYFANLFSSLFLFISVIFFTSKLADLSEIIAMKSAGMSFKRLLRPYLLSAGLIAIATFVLGWWVIPKSTEKKVQFEAIYLKKKTDLSSGENLQLQVDTGVVAFFKTYDNDTKTAYSFSLDKFERKKLVSRLTARVAQYDTLSQRRYQWHLTDYSIRTLKGRREVMASGAQLDTIIQVEPSDLHYTRNQQETMTGTQLMEYVQKQKMRGAANVVPFEVEFHKRFATPFAAFVLTVIGVSLSCEKRKGGMGLSLGIGLALTFTYIMIQTISSSLAINAGFPAPLAVWIPNVLFAGVAYFLYRRVPR